MNREDIIRMARKAGAVFDNDDCLDDRAIEIWARFAAIVAAAEREASEFEKWWNDETSIEPHPTNNYGKDSAAYWAYQGWMYGGAAEREACAKVCDAEHKWLSRIVDRDGAGAAAQCAYRIRARGDA